MALCGIDCAVSRTAILTAMHVPALPPVPREELSAQRGLLARESSSNCPHLAVEIAGSPIVTRPTWRLACCRGRGIATLQSGAKVFCATGGESVSRYSEWSCAYWWPHAGKVSRYCIGVRGSRPFTSRQQLPLLDDGLFF